MKRKLAGLAALSLMLTSNVPAASFVLPVHAEETEVQNTEAVDNLKSLIAACNQLNEDAYTLDSWKALDEALSAAELLDESADDDAIAQAVSAIEEAKAALVSSNPNLALNKPVSVSGLEVNDGRFTADLAVDGVVSATSRVSFDKSQDEQWLLLDLEEEKTISSFVIRYESQAPSYEIQVSTDNETFTTVYSVTGQEGGKTTDVSIDIEPVQARYVRYVQHERWQHASNGRLYSGSIYEFEVYEKNPEAALLTTDNLALNKAVSVSGLEVSDGRFTEDLAVDGDLSTRVSFDKSQDEQWLLVDLGVRRTVSRFAIHYESVCPSYYIEVSTDGEHYTKVYEVSGLESGPATGGGAANKDQIINIPAQKARYVRYVQTERWLHSNNQRYSGSIYEFEIFKDIEDRLNASEVLATVDGVAPTVENGKLVLPEVPEGFTLSLHGCDNQNVVALDGTVTTPLEDMTINVLYKVTNTLDAEDTATSDKDTTFTVAGKYQAQENDNARPNVMPGIREWKGDQGELQLISSPVIVYTDPSLEETANQIASYILEMTNLLPRVEEGSSKAGTIVLEKSDAFADAGEEGYHLVISDRVTISSSTDTGVLYGGTTVTQILSQSEGTLPKGEARDYPRYEVRAGMLDVARTWIPLDYLKEMSRYMAYFKFNEVHVHINDYWGATQYSAFRLESDTYPQITATDGYYTKEDYKNYQKEMKQYGLDVITEIDTPYHAQCFSTIPGVVMLKTGYLDIREESSYRIVEAIMDEYLDGDDPVIQSENFHIGTDEYDKAYSEEMRQWTDHFINYVNNKGYKCRLWGSLGSRGFNGETPVSTDATVNLWAPYWADVQETFDAGYDIINTCGGWLYIVPGANAGYPDRLNISSLYTSFEVNNFAPNRYYGQGTKVMAKAQPQTKGAEFCVWNDMTSFNGGFSWFDIYDRFKDAVMLLSEKTWYGERTEGQTAAEFVARAESLWAKAPGANPGRVVDSDGDVIASVDFTNAGTDASANGYDAMMEGVSYKKRNGNTYAYFDGSASMSMPFASLGYPYTVSFDLNLAAASEDGALFEGADGKLVTNVNGTGKLGYERGIYQFVFDYELPRDEWVHLTITGDATHTTLYVNGEKIGTGISQITAINNRKDSDTFVLPTEQIMNGLVGSMDNLTMYNRVLSLAEIQDEAGIELPENVALNKPATASSSFPGRDWTPDKAVDGIDLDADSRWSSKRATGAGSNEDDGQYGSREQWLMVDLEDVISVDTVKISWEAAFATHYTIQGSLDGETFFDIKDVTDVAQAGVQTFSGLETQPVRYIRILCIDPKTPNYGYSIYELEVYAADTNVDVDPVETDKTLLAMAVDYALALDESVFENINELVKARFDEALANAQAILEDPSASQSAVDNAWIELSGAIHMLNFRSDKSELLALIALCEQIDLNGYKEDGQDEFLAALEYAKEVAEDPAALDEQSIQAAIDRLSAALAGLEAKDELDTTLLEMLVAAVKDTDLSVYTAATTPAFEEALANAQAVLANPESQEQINNAVSELHSAFLNLRLAPDEELLARLQSVLDALNNADFSTFGTQEQQFLADLKADLHAALNENLDALDAMSAAQLDARGETALKLLAGSALEDALTPDASASNTNAAVKTTTTNTAAGGLMAAAAAFMASGSLGAWLSKKRKKNK